MSCTHNVRCEMVILPLNLSTASLNSWGFVDNGISCLKQLHSSGTFPLTVAASNAQSNMILFAPVWLLLLRTWQIWLSDKWSCSKWSVFSKSVGIRWRIISHIDSCCFKPVQILRNKCYKIFGGDMPTNSVELIQRGITVHKMPNFHRCQKLWWICNL